MKGKQILEEPDSALVCYCAKVSKGGILKAVREGHASFEQLRSATGVCPEQNDCLNNNPHGRCCGPEVMALLQSMIAVNAAPLVRGKDIPQL